MQVAELQRKAMMHKRAGKKFEQAARLLRDAYRAMFEAESIESDIEQAEKVNTIIRKHAV